MKIHLNRQFNDESIAKLLAKEIELLDRKIYEKLDMIGIEFVNNARLNGDYTDRTGNLRSSIGYIIFKDGEPYGDNFRLSDKGTDRVKGLKTGMRKAVESGNIPQKGFALVVIAGMNYAIYVERKGFDVISGSSLQAEKDLKEALKSIIL